MKKNFLNEDGSDTRFRIELPEGLKEYEPNPTEMQSNPINFWELVQQQGQHKDNFWEGITYCAAINCDKPYNRPNKPISAAPPSAMPLSVPKESSVPEVPPSKSTSKNYLYIGLGIAAIIIGATLVIKNKTI